MTPVRLALGLAVALGAVACDNASVKSDGETAETSKDKKDKKDKKRKGKKVDDDDSAKSSSPPPVAPPPPPPAPASADPAPASPSFSKVEPPVYMPRLGPKMKAGSKVVHDVFEGPFGPSPRSLFAVTERPDHTFWVYVMGDDDQAWPAGPCADPDMDVARKIMAVAFFDADGDGSVDALVMASYTNFRGQGPYNKNILLEWTSQGMRRLLTLEPDIESLESVDAVRRKLGR